MWNSPSFFRRQGRISQSAVDGCLHARAQLGLVSAFLTLLLYRIRRPCIEFSLLPPVSFSLPFFPFTPLHHRAGLLDCVQTASQAALRMRLDSAASESRVTAESVDVAITLPPIPVLSDISALSHVLSSMLLLRSFVVTLWLSAAIIVAVLARIAFFCVLLETGLFLFPLGAEVRETGCLARLDLATLVSLGLAPRFQRHRCLILSGRLVAARLGNGAHDRRRLAFTLRCAKLSSLVFGAFTAKLPWHISPFFCPTLFCIACNVIVYFVSSP